MNKLNILEIYFFYNKRLEEEKNFNNHITKIKNTLKSIENEGVKA